MYLTFKIIVKQISSVPEPTGLIVFYKPNWNGYSSNQGRDEVFRVPPSQSSANVCAIRSDRALPCTDHAETYCRRDHETVRVIGRDGRLHTRYRNRIRIKRLSNEVSRQFLGAVGIRILPCVWTADDHEKHWTVWRFCTIRRICVKRRSRRFRSERIAATDVSTI